jgi:hypothetical protein
MSGPGDPLVQGEGVYANCVAVGFNCDAYGNYVPPLVQGAYSITVPCGGTFAEIDCAAPPQAVADSQGVSILTSLGIQSGLLLLSEYQADPMSESGKAILQQLGQMSNSATAFIIAGYGSSVLGSVGGAVIGDLAQGPTDSILFGTRYQGNAALLNSNDSLRIGWSYISADDAYVFRIGGDWLENLGFENPHINLWPPSWWFGPPGP